MVSTTEMASGKKHSVWTKGDEQALIIKWEERANDLRRVKRNAHIYNNIAIEMGSKYSAKEVYIKIKKLSKKYREEKEKRRRSAGNHSTWRHFSAVHRIVGNTAMNTAPTSESFSMNSSQLTSPSPSSLPSPSPTVIAPLSPIMPLLEVPVSPVHTVLTTPLAAVTEPSSAIKKVEKNGSIEAIMMQQTKLLENILEGTRVLTNQIDSAVEQNNYASERIISLMEKLIDKI
ncbi:uncharacterized protein LOC128866687 [Anastrepha ludens]|uniref:uncharacterized protein LOC128866687 n=1 Tax=Anastrepha ludens TaxID=28586 RepID=UPI0023B01168|nr:uncharacterized protein LOC128866687 [Anastrepha ludens]